MSRALITGVVGQVKWSYYVAAAINGYSVSRGMDGAWSLRGTVVMSDAFKMAQTPLTFVAPVRLGKPPDDQPTEWRWPIVSAEVVNGTIIARLGPPDDGTNTRTQ